MPDTNWRRRWEQFQPVRRDTPPLVVLTPALASGTVGSRYDNFVRAGSGPPPYVWSRVGGIKPPGLSFSASGVWTGTPTSAGRYTFSVEVTDAYGAKATRVLTIVINAR